MKLIHCADLHLDSAMKTHLDKERTKQRRAEILHTFERMVDYAADNHISIILIAGDMFDKRNIAANTRNVVLQKIIDNPGIRFYYLCGNHDHNNFLTDPESVPENLFLFDEQWRTYRVENLAIAGIELNKNNNPSAYISYIADPKRFNIVMMHGQEAEGERKDQAEIINLKEMRNKGIDYLALGHIHKFKLAQLDGRAQYCYPGCLEGRGFDECGEHGFVELDIDPETHRYTAGFVPFAARNLYDVEVDISGLMTSYEIVERIKTELQEKNYSQDSLIRVSLTGQIDVECEKDLAYIEAHIGKNYYFFRLEDRTGFEVNYEDYLHDPTLKGAFVKAVMEDNSIPEQGKSIVIRYGIQAISGEEIQ